jgi:hypothetical protein
MTELYDKIADYERRIAEWKPKEELELGLTWLQHTASILGLSESNAKPKKPRAKAQPKCTNCLKAYSRHRGEKRICPKHPDSEWRP